MNESEREESQHRTEAGDVDAKKEEALIGTVHMGYKKTVILCMTEECACVCKQLEDIRRNRGRSGDIKPVCRG